MKKISVKSLSKFDSKTNFDSGQLKNRSQNNGNMYHNYSRLRNAIAPKAHRIEDSIAQHRLSDCLEILEDAGIPPIWGIDLLLLIQADIKAIGGMN